MLPNISFEDGYFIATMPPGIDTKVILNFFYLEFRDGLFNQNSIVVFATGAFLFIPKDISKIHELLINYSQNSKRQKTALVVDSKINYGFINSFIKGLPDLSFEHKVFFDLAKAKRWITE